VSVFFFFFFFFQAEDGIRDFHVTGVQTCALPIYRATCHRCRRKRSRRRNCRLRRRTGALRGQHRRAPRLGWCAEAERGDGPARRSEERRVGKEGRGRRAPEEEKKKGREATRERGW